MLLPMNLPVRPAALGAQLADLLRARIVLGELETGMHLVEDQLAAQHDVSRGPVRDALRILQAEGLVEPRRRGFHVRGISTHDIDELYEVREALEQLACRLAITQRANLGECRTRLTEMFAAADRGDAQAFAASDLAFHERFYVVSGNHRLANIWAQLQPTFAALVEVTTAQDGDLHPAAKDHETLLKLAEAGDVDGYSSQLTQHLAGSRRRMLQALQTRRSAQSSS